MLEALRFFALDSNLLFEPFGFVPASALIAFGGLLLFILGTLKYIKKSARRHLILFEVCITGFLGLAFSAYGWLYDTNMHFDKSKPQIASYELARKYTERHRSRRSSYTTYHLELINFEMKDVANVKVGNTFYSQVEKGDFIKITKRSGFLKHAWMENIEKCLDCNRNW